MIRKYLFSVVCGIVCILLTCSFIFYPTSTQREKGQTIVRIWNIDTFEGGKGSRTNFLKKVAKEAEKKSGVEYLISSVTKEGYLSAKEADLPHILSYGVGLGVPEKALPLDGIFKAGELENKTYALPWAMGAYYLFCFENDFEKEGNTVISNGGENLVEAVAYLEGVQGKIEESQTAYVDFLSGKYRYLLGTQRDICRFNSRQLTVYQKPLAKYNDLFMCLSVCKLDKYNGVLTFLHTIMSDIILSKLSEIGFNKPISSGSACVSFFSSPNALKSLKEELRAGNGKNLEKFLKII